MENKVKIWLARDKDGSLWLCQSIPLRDEDGGILFCDKPITQLDSSSFPSVKCEDNEPTEAYITLAESQSEKEQPQSKQEQTKQNNAIDWEQRRYEIAKEMLPVLYQQSAEILKCGQSVTWEDTVGGALKFADMLIQKLKEQSK